MTGSQASRTAIACSASIGLAALALASFANPLPRLIYNPSDSVPVGWYRVDPLPRQTAHLQVGSVVLVHLPAEAAALAAQRGYLPVHLPLLKRVGAVAPQHVCITGQVLRIDGHTDSTQVLTIEKRGCGPCGPQPFWHAGLAPWRGRCSRVDLLAQCHLNRFSAQG